MNKVFGLNGNLISELKQGTPLKHPATPYSEINFPSVNKLNNIKHKLYKIKWGFFFSKNINEICAHVNFKLI